MDILLLTVVIIVILALIFDFINGFHDTANAIATAVSTRALTPRRAILIAATMNFLGALTFTCVAQTITIGIADPFDLDNGLLVIVAALISAIIWNLLTWYLGIPSSSSHAIIGAIDDSVIVSAGAGAVHFYVFISIVEGLIFSPFIAFFIGYNLCAIIKVSFFDGKLAKPNNQ